MKRKYQQGGGFNLPFVVYQPTDIPTSSEQSGTTKEKKDKSDSGIDMDEVYNLLDDLKNVLPGDLAAAKSKLSSLFNTMELKLTSGNDLLGGTSSIAYEYLSALTLVNKLKFAHEEYKTAQEQAIDSGSINEYAINSRGQVIVVGEDGFEWKTPEEIFESDGAYTPITNQELLNFRAQGKGGLAFNSEALTTVSNGIGIAKVTEMISAAVEKLGTTTESEQGYAKVKAGQMIQGLESFIEARDKSGNYNATIEDLYKAGILNADQASQAKLALNYIYNSLPQTAVSLLKMKSDGTVSGAKAMIDTLVYSKISTKTELNSLSLEAGPSDKTKDDSNKSNPYLQLLRGEGGTQSEFILVPGEPGEDKIGEGNEGLTVSGVKYSVLPGIHEEMSLDALLSTGLDYLDISNKRGICFGDQLLNKSDFSHVMFDNEGAHVVTLPVMYDMLGNPRVNLSLLDDYEIVKKELKKYKHLSGEALLQKEAELLHKYELDELIDPNTGLPDQTRTANFLVVGAYATDKIELDKNSRFIETIDKPSEHLTQRIMRGLSLDKKKVDYDLDVNDHWSIFEWGYDEVYRANVFIPLTQNPNAAFNAQGTNLSESDVSAYEKQYKDFLKLIKMKPTNDE